MTTLHITVPAELSTPAVRLLLKNPTTDRRILPGRFSRSTFEVERVRSVHLSSC